MVAKRKILGAVALAIATLTMAASSAGATIAPNSNGIGVCRSQIAIDPSQVGLSHIGEGIRTLAGPGLPALLDGDRNACGEPPGPGHL